MTHRIKLSGLKTLLATTVLVASLGLADNARAGGFYIQEQSVSGLGSAFAGVSATPRDASTLFYNIAGMTHLEGTHATLGASILSPDANMTDTGSTLFGPAIGGSNGGNPFDPAIVPHAYFTRQITDDFWIGLGVSAPFGLKLEYNFGRYDSIHNELTTIDVQPSMAYRVNDWISVGAGVNYQYIDAKLTKAVNDGTQGISTLEGEDQSFAYTASVLIEPWENTRFGVNYRASVSHDLQGRAHVRGTAGSDFDIAASARLVTPDIANFSVSHDLDDQWTLLGQANWYGWNNFNDITVRNAADSVISTDDQNYQAVWGYAIGAEYKWDDQWTFRGGFQFDNTPTTDEYRTTRIPDGDRKWFTAGGTYKMDDKWSFDLGLAYIDVSKESINRTHNSGTAVVNANSDGSVAIVALGLNYKF